MRFLYFINHIYESGGIEKIVIDKINYLANIPGNEIFLAFGEEDKSFFPINNNIKKIQLDLSAGHNILSRISSCLKLINSIRNLIKTVKPDIIVNANVPLISWILPFVHREIPKIIELHFSYEGLLIMNTNAHSSSQKAIVKLNNFLRQKIYPLYTKCVVLTEEDVSKWGFKNCICIPNFVATPKSLTNISKENKRAINVGRLEVQKNHSLLIDAWNIVHKKYPDWTLDIYGNGSLKSKLEEQIKRLKLQDSVYLKGVTQDINLEYSKSSIFVLSSQYEGFPMVLLEALTNGLPSVSFAITGTKELIKDDSNGYLAQEQTAASLSDAIIKQIDALDRIEEMSNAAKQSVSKYNISSIMKTWLELFNQITRP